MGEQIQQILKHIEQLRLTSGWNWTPHRGLIRCFNAIIFSTPWFKPQAIASNSSGIPSVCTTKLLNWIAPNPVGILLNKALNSCLIEVNWPWIGAGALPTWINFEFDSQPHSGKFHVIKCKINNSRYHQN